MLHLEGDNYVIRSGNSSFADRQKSIFDQLDIAAKNNTNTSPRVESQNETEMDLGNSESHEIIETTNEKKPPDTKQFKGKESIFKRPAAPLPNKLKRKMPAIPDYQRNPHKWTKYSLCDVSEDDMSERSNTAAAMAFLKEIQSRRIEEPMETEQKIRFKQPVKKTDKRSGHIVQTTEEDNNCYFRGSKLVMPEYVVGEKKAKKKTRTNTDGKYSKKEKSTGITLNHLTEEDLDDDDDDM